MRGRLQARLQEIGRRLAKNLDQLAKTRAEITAEEELAAAFEVIETYERLSGEVYRLRGAREERQLAIGEDMLKTAAHEIVGLTPGDRHADSGYVMFLREYREIWRRHFNLFVFTACLFLGTVLIGWDLGVNQPDYVPLFVGNATVESILEHRAWFEKIQMSPLVDGFMIALNNIKVATAGLLLGSLFGIGSIYILAMNGLMFGAILGYCRIHGFDSQLLGFVVSHGPLELTIIVASCFAGLLLGRVFYMRPWTGALFRKRIRLAAREAGVLALGIIPWLIVAACFEAGVSPWPNFSIQFKVGGGLSIALLFWIWTFAPVPQAKRDVRKRE